jgi:hypothetical protein
MINTIIQTARQEIGYLEKRSNSQLDSKTANAGSGNFTKYARDVDAIPDLLNGNKQGFSWCAVWVIWLFLKSFGLEKARKMLLLPVNALAASCTYWMRYYKNAGRFFKDPQPGDQVFFGSGDTAEHTGIVTEIKDGRVYTIEGNTSSQSGVVSNGGGVFEKSYPLDHSKIIGYGRPLYDEEPEKLPDGEGTDDGFTEAAEHFDTAKIGAYIVKECSGLNLRTGAGTEHRSLDLLPAGTPLVCLGYYTGDWLRVETQDNRVGFCHSDYLIRRGG